MEDIDMVEKIKDIISESAYIEREELESIGDDELLSNIGLDSVNLIYVVGEIETEYDFTFQEEELILQNFETISKIVTMIKEHIN